MRATLLVCVAYVLVNSCPAVAQSRRDTDACHAWPKSISSTHTLPKYPPQSAQENRDGLAVMQIHINPAGSADTVTLLKSSGFAELDNSAISMVQGNWRWEPLPAGCAGGVDVPVTFQWTVSATHGKIDFGTLLDSATIVPLHVADLPPEARKKKYGGMTVIAVRVSDGEPAVTVVTVASSTHPELDARAEEIAKTRYVLKPATLDGKPLESWSLLEFNWSSVQGEIEMRGIFQELGLPLPPEVP